MDSHIWMDSAALFLPLLGAGLAGFSRARVAQGVTCAAMIVAAVLSALIFKDVAFGGAARTHVLGTWIQAGAFKADWALRIDTLSALMMVMVTVVSAMVHLYSIAYMKGDKSIPRFMAYLSLFTFFMLILVSANNLLQMFFGWEGVGLCSFLLIGFWYEKQSASAAAMKAFIVNRIGDFGFILGLFGCYQLFGSLDLDVIFAGVSNHAGDVFTFGGHAFPAITVLALLLFVGAMGKSAQLGLHTWLPDAMEGPTPVSALIHAATMVTAGVFMVSRLSPLFECAPVALHFITLVGAVTAFGAACIGITQFDIKRVIAYSTISQLGYMFFAAGVSAYGASMFHLVTHAFFKALLFLAAGSVIHAMGGEQDMRKMGGLWRKIPVTYALMWIGSLALAGIGIEGIGGFSGFYSKDMILEAAFARGTGYGYLAYALGLMAAFMTTFYSWRLLALTFHGAARHDAQTAARAHESSWVMLAPLMPLALGAIVLGAVAHGWFASAPSGAFWQGVLAASSMKPQRVQEIFKLLPFAFALAGLGLSSWLYIKRPSLASMMATQLGGLYRLVAAKFYVDEVYDRLLVRPLPRLGAWLWRQGDDGVIDRFGPDGIAGAAQKLCVQARRAQTGYVFHYALAMAAGLIVMIGWVLIKGVRT